MQGDCIRLGNTITRTTITRNAITLNTITVINADQTARRQTGTSRPNHREDSTMSDWIDKAKDFGSLALVAFAAFKARGRVTPVSADTEPRG